MIQKSLGTVLSAVSGSTVTPIGRLRAISEIRLTSEDMDVTALDSPDGFREYAQGVRDSGEVTVEGYYDSDNTGQTLLRTLYFSGASQTFKVVFPDESGVSFTAYVKSVSLGSARVDQPVAFAATLRITGKVTML